MVNSQTERKKKKKEERDDKGAPKVYVQAPKQRSNRRSSLLPPVGEKNALAGLICIYYFYCY